MRTVRNHLYNELSEHRTSSLYISIVLLQDKRNLRQKAFIEKLLFRKFLFFFDHLSFFLNSSRFAKFTKFRIVHFSKELSHEQISLAIERRLTKPTQIRPRWNQAQRDFSIGSRETLILPISSQVKIRKKI